MIMTETRTDLYLDKSMCQEIVSGRADHLRELIESGYLKPLISTLAPSDPLLRAGATEVKNILSRTPVKEILAVERDIKAKEKGLSISVEPEIKQAILAGAYVFGTADPELIAHAEKVEDFFGLKIRGPEQLNDIYSRSFTID